MEPTIFIHLRSHPSIKPAKQLTIKVTAIDGFTTNKLGSARVLAQGGPYDIDISYEDFDRLMTRKYSELTRLIRAKR